MKFLIKIITSITFILLLFSGCSNSTELEEANLKYEELNGEFETLSKDYETLSTDYEEMKKKYNEQKAAHDLLSIKYDTLEKEYNSYKKEMAPYEKLQEADREKALQKLEEEEAAKKAEKEEKEKVGYETGITYDQLARTPDDYEGEKVKFRGKVIQVLEGTDEIQIRLAVNDNYDTVLYCGYEPSIVTSRVLENDYITVYGISMGLLTYDSTMGGQITIPSVWVEKIDN